MPRKDFDQSCTACSDEVTWISASDNAPRMTYVTHGAPEQLETIQLDNPQ